MIDGRRCWRPRGGCARGLVPVDAVVAVCCSTQGEGTIPVDREGRALMNGVLWMDMRGAPYLQRHARGALLPG